MGEFERIAKFFRPLSGAGSFDLTDDTAQIKPYIISTDTLVEGVHFIGNESPDTLAKKLLAVNISDIASKGAKPYGYTLNTTLPKGTDEDWFASFSNGLNDMQRMYGMQLLGGDSTYHNGGIVISATIFGLPQQHLPLRSNAKVGDIVCVTGGLGAGGFSLLAGNGTIEDDQLLAHYQTPQPHLIEGITLCPYINSCCDISDGLISDLGHIADASGVAINLYYEDIPHSNLIKSYVRDFDNSDDLILSGGDDYVLTFTLSEKMLSSTQEAIKSIDKEIFIIGVVDKKLTNKDNANNKSVRIFNSHGSEMNFTKKGYQHY